MKSSSVKKKITRFYPIIPQCDEKPFVCGHKTCKLWCSGYGVRVRKLWIFKWLEWELPTVKESK